MYRIVAKLRAAAGLGLIFLGAPAQPAAGPFDGLPDVAFAYYDVSGRTAAEIRAAMNRVRPAYPDTGMRVDGYTRWSMRWDVPGSPEGMCRPDQAVVMLDVTVGLPRLVRTDEVPPAVLQNWQRYMAALEAHEAGHVRLAYEGRDAVLRAIRQSDCATGPQAARDALEATRRRNDEYDRVTRNGATEGVHFP